MLCQFFCAMFLFFASLVAPAHSSPRLRHKEEASTNPENHYLSSTDVHGSRWEEARKLHSTCDGGVPGRFYTLRNPLDITMCLEFIYDNPLEEQGEAPIADLMMSKCKKETEEFFEDQMWYLDDNGYMRNGAFVVRGYDNGCILADPFDAGLRYSTDCTGWNSENTKWEQSKVAVLRPQFYRTMCLSLDDFDEEGFDPNYDYFANLQGCGEATPEGLLFL